MHSGIHGMNANPFDAISGSSVPKPARGVVGSDDFSKLLGLFPQLESLEAVLPNGNRAPVLGAPAESGSFAGLTAATNLLVPLNLARELGLDAQPPPGSTKPMLFLNSPITSSDISGDLSKIEKRNAALPVAEDTLSGSGQRVLASLRPGSIAEAENANLNLASSGRVGLATANEEGTYVPVKADLLSSIDGGGDVIYLSIQKNGEAAASALFAQSDNGQEKMLLPMRLRTVERADNRIIADADLQTAAGKDISVRLRLELAGSSNGISKAGTNRIDLRDVASEVKPMPLANSLPKMLNDLGVKSMVIETVEENHDLISKPVLPAAAGKPERIHVPGMGRSNSARIPSSQTLMADPVASGDNGEPVVTTGEGNRQADIASFAWRNGTDMEQMDAAKAGMFRHVLKPAVYVESAVKPQSSEPINEPRQIHFFDLDHKLEQLKVDPRTKIQIQLVPSRLGKMDLSIFSHRGMVTVKLMLGSMQAKQALESNLAKLENQLSAAGIKVDAFQIQVNQTSKQEAAHQHYNPHYGGDFSGRHYREGRHHYMNDNSRLSQFSLSDTTFEQTMVNCLA